MEDSLVLDEYGKKVPGCFRPCKPHCPYVAVIPSYTLETKEGLRDIADCLVHVSDINTTYYVDDKHRIMTVWAGPVEVDDYDYETNPLGLRSQYVIDRTSGRMVYYNAVGDYSVMPLTDPTEQVTKTYVDDQDADVLADAKDYADNLNDGILDDAKEYTDTQTADALAEAKAYTDAHTGGGSTSTYIDLTILSVTPTSSGYTISAAASMSLAAATAIWNDGGNIKYRINLTTSPDPTSIATGVYEISPLYIGAVFGTASYTDPLNNQNMVVWHENDGTTETVTVDIYDINTALGLDQMPVITMTSSDPGEGATLAANNFIAVYSGGN